MASSTSDLDELVSSTDSDPVIDTSDTPGRPSSYGLICVRLNQGKYEMLLIRSKHTWQRAAIVHGKYGNEIRTPEDICTFVGKMTIAEKQSIVNSEAIEYDEPPSPSSHVDMHEPDEFCFICQYRECYNRMFSRLSANDKREYEMRAIARFKRDMPVLIRPMLKSIKNGENGVLPWSIPKGRSKYRICDGLSVAIKEFTEETQITPDMYDLHPEIPPFAVQYIDAGKKWSFEFFFASAKDNLRFRYNPECKEQSGEVSLIQWHTVESLSELILDPITREQLCDKMPAMFLHYHTHMVSNFTPLSKHFRVPSPKNVDPNGKKVQLRPYHRTRSF